MVLLTFLKDPSESPSTLRLLNSATTSVPLLSESWTFCDLAAGVRRSGTDSSLRTSTERVTSRVKMGLSRDAAAAVGMFGVDLVFVRLFRTGGFGGE